MNQRAIKIGVLFLFAGAAALAQQPPPGQGPGPGADAGAPPQPGFNQGGRGGRGAPPPPRTSRPPMERAMQPGPPGRWWNNPEMVQKLSLNSDQQKKMDDLFQQNRLKLIDLNATVQKEEFTLEPLMAADAPDEPKILAQIDRVAQARAELEKANARFLLGIRRVLTADQWKKLQTETPGAGRGRGENTPPPPPGGRGR